MLGFAIVDRRASDKIAVWLTSRVAPLAVDHTNAVLVDPQRDSDGLETVRNLTRDRVVLLTEGSTPVGLPIDGEPLSVTAAAEDLAAEVQRHQTRVLDALNDYSLRPNPKTGRAPKSPRKVIPPEFGACPSAADFHPVENTPVGRALASANYLRAMWSWWLRTDHERARRASRPDGEPWMMPEDLAGSEVADLPDGFARRVHLQPEV